MTNSTTYRPRGRASARAMGTEDATDFDRDHQYDLLTAALLGAAVGATAVLLLAAGVRGSRRNAGARGIMRRGRRWAARQGAALGAAFDRRDQVSDALASARDSITNTVEGELKDLRKAMRRQRRRLGL